MQKRGFRRACARDRYTGLVRCLSCDYDLRDLSSGSEYRCPECGRAFDPNDPKTFATPLEPVEPFRAREIPRGLAAVFFVVAIVIVTFALIWGLSTLLQ
jgi:hypothetical protein